VEIPKGLDDPDVKAVPYECPHCGVLSQHDKSVISSFQHHKSVGRDDIGITVYYAQEKHVILVCLNCKETSYLLFNPPFQRGGSIFPGSKPEISHVYPVATSVLHQSIPRGIQDAAIEAEKCFGVGAHNACGVMTRRAMHSLCVDKGATGKDLFAQLKDLKDRHIITPDLWEWSEELRVLGRNGAHPEWPEVTSEDAQYGINFLREIIRYVYINPSERNARRLKETSQKA
jgi:hypothetical protein